MPLRPLYPTRLLRQRQAAARGPQGPARCRPAGTADEGMTGARGGAVMAASSQGEPGPPWCGRRGRLRACSSDARAGDSPRLRAPRTALDHAIQWILPGRGGTTAACSSGVRIGEISLGRVSEDQGLPIGHMRNRSDQDFRASAVPDDAAPIGSSGGRPRSRCSASRRSLRWRRMSTLTISCGRTASRAGRRAWCR